MFNNHILDLYIIFNHILDLYIILIAKQFIFYFLFIRHY